LTLKFDEKILPHWQFEHDLLIIRLHSYLFMILSHLYVDINNTTERKRLGHI